jgi:hypothetical protein
MMSDNQTDLLRQWLRNCNRHHTCHPNPEGTLPARVLDVGDPDEDQHSNYIKLYVTDATKDKGKYLALSHCWGVPAETIVGPDPMIRKTTSGNIDSFLTTEDGLGIDISRLPKNFIDAVTVTRQLKLRYLWIDSFCIIQDSAKDWLDQSQKMGDIYNSAYFTIAATRAEGSEEGFLQHRGPRQCVTIRPEGETPYYVCDMIDNFRDDVENATLNQRGWVLQERALSRRTIHFAANQIYWECGKGIHCETLTKMRK